MTTKLIIALDFEKEQDALNLVEQLNPMDCALKVGNEMFTRLGPQFVKRLVDCQFKIFLDLKFHDIPNTVARACGAAADLGVWMLNVHAAGGMRMMQAAVHSLSALGKEKPLLIAVTVLTSFADEELKEIGISNFLPNHVSLLSKLAQNAGLDGVVCSAFEVGNIKNLTNNQFITVCPGIRLDNNQRHDQTRVMTPNQAAKEGSDYLVVGRAITTAAKPLDVIDQIKQQLQLA